MVGNRTYARGPNRGCSREIVRSKRFPPWKIGSVTAGNENTARPPRRVWPARHSFPYRRPGHCSDRSPCPLEYIAGFTSGRLRSGTTSRRRPLSVSLSLHTYIRDEQSARHSGDEDMCLWKLLLWKRPATVSSSADKGLRRGGQHRPRPSLSSLSSSSVLSSDDDDLMSDSGISSGEFSLENVCEDPCPDPQPPSQLKIDDNRYSCLKFHRLYTPGTPNKN